MTRKKYGIPDTVIIMGSTWTVRRYDVMQDVDPNGAELLWGHKHGIRRELRVYVGGSEFYAKQSLHHEIVHAIADEMGLKFSENESEVDMFAKTWTDTMTRNRLKMPRMPEVAK